MEDELTRDQLVERLENYSGGLVPSRPGEAAVADDLVGDVLFAERQFRGWYERCSNAREMLEDPDLRRFPERS